MKIQGEKILAALLMALPIARRYLVAIAISENGSARLFLFRNVISMPDAFWECTESGSETVKTHRES